MVEKKSIKLGSKYITIIKDWKFFEKLLKYLLINFEKNILINCETLHR
jgi:hypothetical protein